MISKAWQDQFFKGMAEEVGFGRHCDLLTPFCREYHCPWFEGQKEERSFVTSVSGIMSGNSSVRSHLDRFRIVEDPMCVCLKDYESVDHLIWHCERFGSERHRLIDALSEMDVLHGTPVVWTSSEVLKSGFDRTISLSVVVGLEICFIGPRNTFY
jgi:hypothetical protein